MTKEEEAMYERDRQIMADFRKTKSIRKIALKYNLCDERIRQIIHKYQPSTTYKPKFLLLLENYTTPGNARKIYSIIWRDWYSKDQKRMGSELTKEEFYLEYNSYKVWRFRKLKGIGQRSAEILVDVLTDLEKGNIQKDFSIKKGSI